MSRTILIIDDDARLRRFLSTVLQAHGFNVLQAHNGVSGKAVMDGNIIDLAIVDFRLPDIDGIEWITWLRNRGSKLPIVLLSGFRCDVAMLNRLRNVLQVSLVLEKPTDPIELIRYIEGLIADSDQQLRKWLASPMSVAVHKSRDTGHLRELPARRADELEMVWNMPQDTTIIPGSNVDSSATWEAMPRVQEQFGAPEGTDWKALLSTLKEEYGRDLPTMLNNLEALISKAKSDPTELGLIDSIVQEAHKIKGTASSYGFSLVGSALWRIEELLTQVQNDELPLDKQAWSVIDGALHESRNTTREFLCALG